MSYSRRLDEAFLLAHALHRRQVRKGGQTPYITHPMAVAAIVGEYGGDEDQVIAALLHDAVEDQGGPATLARIREAFGQKVADYVLACSDTDEEPKPPWRARKQAFLDALPHVQPEVKLIVAADKLHNCRSILRSMRRIGNQVWKRFTGGRDLSLWYYAEAVRALEPDWPHPILTELADAVDQLHRMAEGLRE